MKVYLQASPELSRGILRVADALARYRPPHVTLVEREADADLRIGHVIGYDGMEEWCARGPYALIQYCLRTTQRPNTKDWIPYWANAKVVWSYYDLVQAIEDDRSVHALNQMSAAEAKSKFYIAPLGVDTRVFQPSVPTRKRFMIGTSGFIADTESVRECYRAANALDHPIAHLGPDLGLGPGVLQIMHVSDATVADLWSQCRYVSGLRRIEGFELPALEGLACGARPVLFDAPHYRQWFGEHGEYIREGTPEEVYQQLLDLFARPVRPVTPVERSHVATQFDWATLCGRFWEAVS